MYVLCAALSARQMSTSAAVEKHTPAFGRPSQEGNEIRARLTSSCADSVDKRGR